MSTTKSIINESTLNRSIFQNQLKLQRQCNHCIDTLNTIKLNFPYDTKSLAILKDTLEDTLSMIEDIEEYTKYKKENYLENEQ